MRTITIRALSLAILYWVGVHIGLLFFEEQISILWPANGIALAFFIATKIRDWPALVVAMAVGYFIGLIDISAQPMAVKAGFLMANYVEIVPAAYFIRRLLAGSVSLNSLVGVLWLLCFGVVMGPFVGSFVATLVASVGFGQAFSLTIWMGWGIGNAVSTLVVVLPTYFFVTGAWFKDGSKWRSLTNRTPIELAILMVCSGLAIYFIFDQVLGASAPAGSIYLLFPLAIWVALRFSMRIASAWLLVVVLLAAAFVAGGKGPFVTGAADFRAAVSHLHAFSFSLCMMGLLLSAIIKDRRANEQRLVAAKFEAEELRRKADDLNQIKSRFLAKMSHEIRTPMNGVVGMADVLALTELTADQRDMAQTISSSGHEMLELLNDILDFSKIEAGRMDIQAEAFCLPEFLESFEGLWAPSAQKKGLAFSIQNNLVGIDTIESDRKRLQQVINNLIGNAIKFTSEGSVELLVDGPVGDTHKTELRFAVRDTGIGIDGEQKEKLFLPFTQADGSSTRQFGGTGLGLAISKELVELLGGEMDVESTPGQGATFWFVIPVERVNAL